MPLFSPHKVRCAANGGGAEVGFARVAWASSLQLAANDQPTVVRGFGGVAPIGDGNCESSFLAKNQNRAVIRRGFFVAWLLVLILVIVCVVRCVVVTIFCKLGSVVFVRVCRILLFIVVHTVLPPFVLRLLWRRRW